MKSLITLVLLATACLLVEASLTKVNRRTMVMPVNPKHTAQEWRDIMAAQKKSPENVTDHKKGTKPQPEFAGKVHLSSGDLRITSGYTASRGQFPWQVALFVDNSFFCGGSVISEQWILTAGHCAGNTYEVRLGANRLDATESGSRTVTSRFSIRHEAYDPTFIRNDIAVVELPQPLQFTNYISPVRLPTYSQQGTSFVGSVLRVSGWGKTYDGATGITPALQFVDLTVITNNECAQTFGSGITSSNLCVSTYGGQSTCNGDSGGPLIYGESDGLYTQVGIVSFGSSYGCEQGYPAVFTRVTSYLQWIESNTGIYIE
ncbi:brachyurin-like [Periplaneta americana]|uniref:brachyurin-like n=1 Tax=Periplaneta americana TaxID=6978 RepID=UPI0037E900C6